MKIINRNRMWEPSADFTAGHGALICRLPGNKFGVYRSGRWDVYSDREFQARFDTVNHLMCDVGGWLMFNKLIGRSTEYFEHFTKASLQSALDRGMVAMKHLINKKAIVIEGEPSRVVSIPVHRLAV